MRRLESCLTFSCKQRSLLLFCIGTLSEKSKREQSGSSGGSLMSPKRPASPTRCVSCVVTYSCTFLYLFILIDLRSWWRVLAWLVYGNCASQVSPSSNRQGSCAIVGCCSACELCYCCNKGIIFLVSFLLLSVYLLNHQCLFQFENWLSFRARLVSIQHGLYLMGQKLWRRLTFLMLSLEAGLFILRITLVYICILSWIFHSFPLTFTKTALNPILLGGVQDDQQFVDYTSLETQQALESLIAESVASKYVDECNNWYGFNNNAGCRHAWAPVRPFSILHLLCMRFAFWHLFLFQVELVLSIFSYSWQQLDHGKRRERVSGQCLLLSNIGCILVNRRATLCICCTSAPDFCPRFFCFCDGGTFSNWS